MRACARVCEGIDLKLFRNSGLLYLHFFFPITLTQPNSGFTHKGDAGHDIQGADHQGKVTVGDEVPGNEVQGNGR